MEFLTQDSGRKAQGLEWKVQRIFEKWIKILEGDLKDLWKESPKILEGDLKEVWKEGWRSQRKRKSFIIFPCRVAESWQIRKFTERGGPFT